MKYLLRILLLSLLLIPFIVWESALCVWTFRSENVKDLWSDYKDTVGFNFRKAFPRRSKKANYF